MMTLRAQSRDVISFGPFSLVANERLLTRAGEPVDLGARALDILLILVSRANEVIGKSELLDLAWPGVAVEEGCLRFHISSLRKALGDGKDGARYISTLPGRGYCFVAPVSRFSDPSQAIAGVAAQNAAVAQTFPANQVFVEQALASSAQLDLSDAEAATVVKMCRKLDGVALAFELAARRIEACGVHQAAALLDQQPALLCSAARGAPSRQKTLQATLDWSYGLLSEIARVARAYALEISADEN